MLRLILTFGLLLPALGLAGSGAGGAARREHSFAAGSRVATSLCAPGERVVWSCEIRGQRKWASICSSPELDRSRGYVQYRFGRPRQIELEFPRERVNTQSAFQYSRYTRPLVTYLKLRFENNGVTYTISDDFNDEERRGRRDAGITIKPSGANSRETSLQCRTPPSGSLTRLEEVVPKGEDEP